MENSITTPLAKRKLSEKRNPKNWEEAFTKIENRIFTQGRFLTSDAKVAYMTLKSFQNSESGLCFPSYDKIIERSNLSRPKLSLALAELEQFRWIKKTKRFSGSTHYELTHPLVYLLDAYGIRVGIRPDQTCPTGSEADEWRRQMKAKRRKPGKSWKATVKSESRWIEEQEKRNFLDDDNIPF